MPVVPSLSGQGLIGLGQGLSQASSALFQIGMREDRVTLKKAEVALAERLRDLQYGNPELGIEGYNGTQNDVAVDGLVPARQTVAMAVETIKNGLPSRLHDRFDFIASGRVDPVLRRYSEHALNQQRATETAVSEARIESATQDALADPANLSRSLAIVSSEVSDMVTRRGITDPTVIQQAIRDAETEAVSGAFNAALAKRDHGAAKEILDNYGAQMEPSAFLKAGLNLAASVQVEENHQMVLEVFNRPGLTDEQRLALIDDMGLPPEQYEKVIRALYNRLSMERSVENMDQGRVDQANKIQEEAERQGLARDQAAEAGVILEAVEYSIKRDLSPLEAEEYFASLRKLHPRQWSLDMHTKAREMLLGQIQQRKQLEQETARQAIVRATTAATEGRLDDYFAANPEERANVNLDPNGMKQLEKLNTFSNKGKQFADTSDGETLAALLRLPFDKLANTDPKLYHPRLTESEARQLQNAIISARKGSDPANPHYPVFTRGHKMLGDYAPNDVKLGANANRDDRQFMLSAENQLNSIIQGHLDSKGVPPTEQELRSYAAQAVMGVQREIGIKRSYWWDRDERMGDLTPQELNSPDAYISLENITQREEYAIKQSAAKGTRYASWAQVPDPVKERAALLLYLGRIEEMAELFQ